MMYAYLAREVWRVGSLTTSSEADITLISIHNIYVSAPALVGNRLDILTENTYYHYKVPRLHYVEVQNPIIEAASFRNRRYACVQF